MLVRSLDQRSQLLVGSHLRTAFLAVSPGSGNPFLPSAHQPRGGKQSLVLVSPEVLHCRLWFPHLCKWFLS